MLTTEQRFNTVKEEMISAEIVFTIDAGNTCCSTCITLEDMGGSEGDAYAYAFYGNTNGIDTVFAETEWRNNGTELFITSQYEGGEKMEQKWDTLHFNFSDEETASLLTTSFRDNDFAVEWDYTEDGCVIVNI